MLKANVKCLVPRSFRRAWNDRKSRRFARHMEGVFSTFTRVNGLQVVSGPFKGMRYIDDAVSSALLPKLIGSYESEFHEAIAKIIATGYTRIIDVGCAEGYYAVGFALALCRARLFAFDTDPRARELCHRLATANGVADRVTILGECSPAALRDVLASDALVICDCEGIEGQLLRPEILPELLHCDLLVELHDFASPGIREQLLGAFGATHHCRIFDPRPRDPSAYPELSCLSESDRVLALSEFRYQPTRFACIQRSTV